ncbi:hypothetical protein TTHERM_000042741 (macronuclear) [Tetrahymena thermophila SB210]|uniref:Uncharacterized protein n=1 Tax=Tetrahymena thermophila (strain SB210) TaxID=312017 RepID=W7XKI1_TETTS|nr:hypothetical protein TTHERM_000042741 [Tetrahymena thermophila SB210]EWS74924.1 hypothetical protein TTHERM_000042741 [Tetrahymena thermophila SB210]|eukprot:XP_012652637.1 hypothetical protein TTHERM_000042741 [Tetrahymena thermophila SB210]
MMKNILDLLCLHIGSIKLVIGHKQIHKQYEKQLIIQNTLVILCTNHRYHLLLHEKNQHNNQNKIMKQIRYLFLQAQLYLRYGSRMIQTFLLKFFTFLQPLYQLQQHHLQHQIMKLYLKYSSFN